MVFLENPAQCLPHLISICEEYGESALLHLNDNTKKSVIPVNVPLVGQFKYLGIDIFPTLNQIVKHNYLVALTNVLKDVDRWSSLPCLFKPISLS